MFDIIIRYFMEDTERITVDDALAYLTTLDMRKVSTIQIAANVE